MAASVLAPASRAALERGPAPGPPRWLRPSGLAVGRRAALEILVVTLAEVTRTLEDVYLQIVEADEKPGQ